MESEITSGKETCWSKGKDRQESLEAEDIIVKCPLKEVLPDSSSTSSYGKLYTFVDPKGVIRVGGRLKLSSLPDRSKHPALLPRHSHITLLVVRHFHNKAKHQGRGITANEIRASGYSFHSNFSAISNCVQCPKLRGDMPEQCMAAWWLNGTSPSIDQVRCGLFWPLNNQGWSKSDEALRSAVHIEVA